ncbi:hypothetical protein EWM64_g716 [Hericium alpestre]|uniref:Uncharacterized protein n=1 Tax=Hericium alpestre TaxID=135208 RepID=A0A4Z0ABB1_9AGAM|nr:hypothetical protein EWM64_g716 [Hericium alpestre]
MTSKGVALVTGAAQGIGRAIALRLADDGFDVAINDIETKVALLRTLSSEIEAKGRKSHPVPGDIAVDEQVKHMVDETVTSLGSLDAMVANAAIYVNKPFIETSAEDFERMYSVNVKGLASCYRYAALQMISQGRGGRIIGASSAAGQTGYPGQSAYCASKFAVRGLTQVAAMELGKHKITVNTYAPGLTRTEMLDDVDAGMKKTLNLSPAEGWSEQVIASLPIPRLARPEDLASLVSFLASKESEYITGQTVRALH